MDVIIQVFAFKQYTHCIINAFQADLLRIEFLKFRCSVLRMVQRGMSCKIHQ